MAFAAASNLLLHFPSLFVIISVLSARGPLPVEVLSRAYYWRLLLDAEVLSRVVHVWLSSAAITGVVLMALAIRTWAETHDGAAQAIIRRGAWLALIATLLQLPTGMWVTLEMPEAAREPLFGGDLIASSLFATSLLLVMLLAHTLAAVALGDPRPVQVRRAAAIVITVVLIMVGTRTRVQQLADGGPGSAALLAAGAR